MNNIENEINGILRSTEKFSGAEGAEGDMSYFDDESYFDDSSDFDGDEMSYASGAGASHAPVSDPYVIQYQNTTTNDVTCYIFGYNDYNGVANYGNPTAAVITSLQGGTYGRIFNQSNNKPFKIGKWRFQSSTASQLQQTLTLTHVDGSGKQYSSPLNLSVMLDAYQQQSTVLDVTKTLSVDGNTIVSFPLKASATCVISMYPINVISSKALLNGGKALNTARAPRLSGKNVAPVIIQTSQAVNKG